ncbi:MAG: N-acetylmuramoyl-L-alanine amidase [Anaerotignum sp.]
MKNPKEVYEKSRPPDAGHGGKYPGTSENGMQEKNLTLTIAEKIEQELRGSGIKVYMTRDKNVYPENSTRAKIANDVADLTVSIHINSGPETANGTETLYQVHANDSSSRLTSKTAAEILQASMISSTGNTNRGVKLRDRFVDIESYHSSVSHCGSGFHYQYRGCFEDFQSCLSGSGGKGNCRRYSGSGKEISSAVKLHKLSEKKTPHDFLSLGNLRCFRQPSIF